MKKIILSLLLISNVSLACNKPVTYLTQGTPSPCTGYLFTPEQEKLVREYKQERDSFAEILGKQDSLISVLDQRVDVLLRRNEGLDKQVKSLESQSKFEKIVYFCLGLAVGITATQALSK